MKKKIVVVWLRRDLRLDDNTALYHALKSGHEVLPIFIFDTNILNNLSDKSDKRVTFIHTMLSKIHSELNQMGSGIRSFYDTPLSVFQQLEKEYDLKALYLNRDYEPYAKQRDEEIRAFLSSKTIPVFTFKDQVIFEENDILKNDGTPYTIFTPYSKQWKAKYTSDPIRIEKRPAPKFIQHATSLHDLKRIGFLPAEMNIPSQQLDKNIVSAYSDNRNIPAKDATSRLSVHLRFGTISIRKCVQFAIQHNEDWLNELIWREFFMQILYHFPQVVHLSFKKKYDSIHWRNNEKEFELWCNGKTGYPLVDAGMHELNQTGFMHNRVRMVVASFLTKHLLVDWRWGEAYFANKLLDYDLSANNGNWQWAAGTGCDAAPYFRIFNPAEQTKRFDPNYQYIKKWLPHFNESSYIEPIVEHKFARERALSVYKKALAEN